MKGKAIAILGGMGPEASAYMYTMLIDLAVKKFGAKNNDEFPELILQSIPVPDFISDTKGKNKAQRMLEERVKELNKLSISCLSIACNTAHVLLPDLQKVSKVPFISMIDSVADAVKRDGLKNVGLIGTPMTTKFGLYQKALAKHNIKTVIPTENQIAKQEKIIRNVIAGKKLQEDSMILKHIADYLVSQGAQGIILGCTELPLVFPKKYKAPVYNSVELLSIALLKRYYKEDK